MDALISPSVGSRSHGFGLRLLTDERLAALASAGHPQAFAMIYERHHAALYRYCRSILTHPEDAGDALQNTMLNAFRSLTGSRRDVPLKPWLFRIAHNESISLLRRRRPHAELDDADEVLSTLGVEAGAEAKERLAQLVADMRELPEAQRGALVMRELSGLSYPEIALALSVSPAAAKQQVYEAHSTLQQFSEGRAMDCDAIRRSLSAGDRRVLRGRKLSSHLRSCDRCKSFQDGLKARRADLMMLAPPLPVGAAAALFSSLFGGGGGGAAGGGGLLAGGGSAAAGGAAAGGGGGGGFWAGITGGASGGGGLFAGAAGGGNIVASSAATKALVPVAVTLGVAGGGMGLAEQTVRPDPVPPAAVEMRAPRVLHDGRTPLERALKHAGPGTGGFLAPIGAPPGSIEQTVPLPGADALVPAEALVPPAVPDPGFASEGELVDVPIALDDTIVEGTEPAPRQAEPDGEATDAVPAPVEPDTVLPATPDAESPLPDDGTVPPVGPAPDPNQGAEGEGEPEPGPGVDDDPDGDEHEPGAEPEPAEADPSPDQGAQGAPDGADDDGPLAPAPADPSPEPPLS